jgi:hypothetical protein
VLLTKEGEATLGRMVEEITNPNGVVAWGSDGPGFDPVGILLSSFTFRKFL